MNNTTEAYTELMGEWQNLMMDNWATWTKATVNSEAFVQASSAMMDWNLASQNKFREMTGQYLEAVDLPRRADLARLSEQVLTVEKRLMDGEEERDELKEQLDGIEAKLEKILSLLEQPVPVEAKPKATVASSKPKAKAKTSRAKTKTTSRSKKK